VCLTTLIILVQIIYYEYVMTDVPLESVMTYLIVEKAHILIFQSSLNILCANNPMYGTFHRKKKVVTFFNPNYMKYFLSQKRSSHFSSKSYKIRSYLS
jgi:hypothetical protein